MKFLVRLIILLSFFYISCDETSEIGIDELLSDQKNKIKVHYVDTLNIKNPDLRDEELNGAKNMLKVVLLQNDEIYDKLLALGDIFLIRLLPV